jgi:hypothetical protein
MTDEEREKLDFPFDAASKQKSLELLFDYTKFHIGIYLTLTAAYITIATAKIKEAPILEVKFGFFAFAVLCFAIAGLSGGVIVSSITQTKARSSQQFLDERIGPWEWKILHGKARKWTWVEHTSFWIGLASAILSFGKPNLAGNAGMSDGSRSVEYVDCIAK